MCPLDFATTWQVFGRLSESLEFPRRCSPDRYIRCKANIHHVAARALSCAALIGTQNLACSVCVNSPCYRNGRRGLDANDLTGFHVG